MTKYFNRLFCTNLNMLPCLPAIPPHPFPSSTEQCFYLAYSTTINIFQSQTDSEAEAEISVNQNQVNANVSEHNVLLRNYNVL